MSESSPQIEIQNAVKKKMMDLLSRRDHSESELRTKLQQKFAAQVESLEDLNDAIDAALAAGVKNKWMSAPEELAQKIAEGLHQKNKGIEYINAYLEEKSLPAIQADSELELEKALAIVKNKYEENYSFSPADHAKIGQMLSSRGFDPETVRKVIHEKL